MSTPILATKLYAPLPQPTVVPRPRLVERLDEGMHRKLSLVSAPAGFGKSTLLGEWVAAVARPTAWLSLDEGDGDPSRFIAYLVAALRTIAPDIGEGVLGALRTSQPPPTESVLTGLLNELAALEDEFVLVLDDYHVVDARAVDDALAFLLEHLPPQMHLVVATREDPPLPLARLRARGQLSEVRAADLRFTPEEAAEFLKGVMGLSLSAEDITVLETRTEGWIAGLQLAALSMRGREDLPGFIRAFAGDNRYIVDYLAEEVLQRQPERIQSFLLQTSILDRLSGPLCEAVTGQEDGSGTLEVLERGNFFVVPLDDKRHWCRYHHLFADVLYAHLMAERPDRVSTLHRRASEWYEHNGSAADAIRHALAAEDFERAADLVERAWPTVRRSRQEALMLGWLEALPGELLRCRPVLGVGYAHVLLAGGELDGVEDRLRDAERWLDTAAMAARPHPESSRPAAATVVEDDEALRRLPGEIAIARAGLALARGDVPGTVAYARRALEVAPEDDHLTRGGAGGFLGLASWTSGDLETAHRTYADGMASLQKAGNISDTIGGAIMLANIRITQGRLREAMGTYERGLRLATAQGAPVLRGAADMHVGMSELLRERDDLDAATQHLLRSKELGEHMGFPPYPYRWRVAMARIREAQGDLDGAVDLLHEAERLYVIDFSPNVRPVAALRARVWVKQGRLDEALGWARERGLSAHDDLGYLREFEHVTLAKVLIAHYESERVEQSIHEATGLLERLLKAAEEGERTGSVIEILVLQALAHQIRGGIPAALVPLEQALTLAQPEGYVRTFVDEGPPMEQLLLEAAARGIVSDYTRKLLAAFGAEPPGRAGESPLSTSPASRPLIEPLSERELEVLRLFGTEFSGPEIANELVVALSTVRTHTKSIYRKLGVNNRRAAVRRAAELGLI
jgi:LuxR family transcriptional regulator, maltose regulon positive regulatory protein